MVLPQNEAATLIASAFWPSPFCARGYASSAVAAEAGVPGMFRMEAEMLPP